MSKIIAKVTTEYSEPIAHEYPWAIVCEHEDENVSNHRTQSEAETALSKITQQYDGEFGIIEKRQRPGGWIVSVHFTDGSGYSYGLEEDGLPYPTREGAEAAAERDRARIGVVDSNMMASSTMSVIVLREAERGLWTVGIGLGSHTKHVRGSYPTADAAEIAGREAAAQAWREGIAYWERIAAEAGIECRVTAQAPSPTVLRPAKGVSAWDAYAILQKATA